MEVIGLVIVTILSLRCIFDRITNSSKETSKEADKKPYQPHGRPIPEFQADYDSWHNSEGEIVIVNGQSHSALVDVDDDIAQMVDYRPIVDTIPPVFDEQKK
jgi:hypothetical protein